MTPILIVENDIILNNLYCRWAIDAGVKVHSASNGMQAIEKIAENKYNLVFMDVFLPDITGINIMKIVKLLPDQPRFQHIFAVTGDTRPSTAEECIQAGFESVCVKPMFFSNFKIIVEQYSEFKLKENEFYE